MRRTLFLFLISFSVAYAQEITPEQKKAYLQKHQDSIRSREIVELSAEVLLLTSSLSTTYSEEGALLNSGIATIPIFSQKTDSINPEYNFGYAVKALYRIPPTRNATSLGYTYILNNGDGHLSRDNSFTRQDGETQRNIQNDRGHQHFHLHMVDLLFSRSFPMYEHISFLLGGGLTFNDFNFYLNFHNRDQVTNTDANGNQLITLNAEIKSQRKTDGWGLGPKLEWNFGFHFTKMDWKHDASINFSLQLATLFSKIWSRGNFSINGTRLAGAVPISVANGGEWEDGSKFQVIPNINIDLAFRYKYETKNNVSWMLTAGYKTYLFWELRELNRVINYRLDSTFVIGAVANADKDTVIFAGPYLRLTVGF